MNYSVIMEEIKSTRDYKNTKVKSDLLKKVVEAGKNALKGHSLEIVLLEDGEKVQKLLEGKAGYYGKFIPAPHYVAVVGDQSAKAKTDAAYVTEMMRFSAHEEGLGTCWITVPNSDEVKAALGIDSAKVLCSFLSIGQIYAGIFKKDTQQKSSRQAATEISFLEKWGATPTWEELSDRGFAEIFYLTRFAPSWGNRQPWKFLVTAHKIYVCAEKNVGEDIDLDFGIVKFYFEKACVDQGIHIQESDTLERAADIPDDYEVRAVYLA